MQRVETMSDWIVRWMALGLVAGMASAGCLPDIAEDDEQDSPIEAVFDSQTSTIPLPNDIALDEEGTIPQQACSCPGGNPEQCANCDFLKWLDGLHGWLPEQTIEVPFTSPLDPSTVTPEAVRLYRFDEQGGIEQLDVQAVNHVERMVNVTGPDGEPTQIEGAVVQIIPASALQRRQQYAAVTTDALQGPGGEAVVAPQPLFFAASSEPLVDENGNKTIASLPDDETAQQLEGLRQFLRPVYAHIESDATELTKKDIVSAQLWTTVKDTFMSFDPTTGNIPVPNEFLRTGDGGRVSLPVPMNDPLQTPIFEELNSRIGFSTIASGWVPVDGTIDTDTIDQNSAFMFQTQNSQRYDAETYELSWEPDWGQLTFTPLEPFVRDRALANENPQVPTLSGMIVTDDVQGPNGWSVKSEPAFVFLSSQFELIEGGATDPANFTVDDILVDQLKPPAGADQQAIDQAKATAASLETGRQRFNSLLGLLELTLQIDRDDLAVAFVFHPENAPLSAQARRAQALTKLSERDPAGREVDAVSIDSWSTVDDPGTNYQGPDGQTPVDLSNVARIQWTAEFDTVDFLNAQSRLVDYESAASTTVGVSVFLPKRNGDSGINQVCGQGDDPFPVAIAQHGLTGWRVGTGRVMANELAARGIATVAMDFPGHGGRTTGAMTLHPSMRPANSGQNFFSTDLIGSKNRALQSVVDVATLTEIIRSGGLETAIDENPATDCFADGDGATVGYVGNSLGGFIGLPAVTIDPTLEAGVFSSSGGKYIDVLTEGSLGGALTQALEQAGLTEGTFERFQTEQFLAWVAEPVDPFAFAPYLQREDLDEVLFDPMSGLSNGDRLPDAEVLMQMAVNPQSGDDSVVPNATTEAVANAAGLSLEDSTFSAPHGFIGFPDPNPMTDGDVPDCARRQAAQWLSDGLTGSTPPNVPSDLTADNCVTSN